MNRTVNAQTNGDTSGINDIHHLAQDVNSALSRVNQKQHWKNMDNLKADDIKNNKQYFAHRIDIAKNNQDLQRQKFNAQMNLNKAKFEHQKLKDIDHANRKGRLMVGKEKITNAMLGSDKKPSKYSNVMTNAKNKEKSAFSYQPIAEFKYEHNNQANSIGSTSSGEPVKNSKFKEYTSNIWKKVKKIF